MLLLAIIVCLILSALIYYTYKIQTRHLYWKSKNVQVLKSSSPFGNISEVLLHRKSISQLIYETYNAFPNEPYFGIHTFQTPTLVLRDPELIKEITAKHIDNFILHRMFTTNEPNHTFSKNLFATDGVTWRTTRRNLTPAFTGSKIRSVFPLIRQCAENTVKYLIEENQEIFETEIKKDFYLRYTTDVISSCIFGLELNSFDDRDNEFYKHVITLARFYGLRLFPIFGYCLPNSLIKLLDLKIIAREDEEFFADVVREAIKTRKEKNVRRTDVLQILIDFQENGLNEEAETDADNTGFATVYESDYVKSSDIDTDMTDNDIVAHSMLFLIAGADTGAIPINVLTYELAKNPDIQKRLQNEVDQVFHKSKGSPSLEDICGMTYLDMVVSETLRKWPSLPVLDRCSTRSHTIKGYGKPDLTLPPNSVVWIPVFALHRDPEYFPNPEKFDPERFRKSNLDKVRNYMPFGFGPRACLGSRFGIVMLKTMIVNVLHNFDIVSVARTANEYELGKAHIFLNSNIPIIMGFKRRHKLISK